MVAQAAGDVTQTTVTFPQLPPFVYDPTDVDWAKFKQVFINLFDTKRSLFANRYKAFQIEWLGPAHESFQEYVARIRQTVALMDGSNLSSNEIRTLLLLMGMKTPVLEPLQPAGGLSKPTPRSPCPACGGAHGKADCKFKEVTCHSCGKKGHISKFCTDGKKKDYQQSSKASVNVGRGYKKKVGTVHVNILSSSSSACNVAVTINGTSMQMQYDSGSDMTILSRQDYQYVGAPSLTPATVRACTANNHPLKLDGYFNSTIGCADGSKCLDIHVADVPWSLLGLDFCNSLTLHIAVSTKPQRGSTPVYDINRRKTNVKPKAAHGRSPGTKVSLAVLQTSVNTRQKGAAPDAPRSRCPGCDGAHWKKDCPYKNSKCYTCDISSDITIAHFSAHNF
uniref:CCHC-type domain-containing protein n=1 Tax=Panagrolaimus sp. PS1159 TaxID=55785 RepID=A0AC35EW25_9BILA